MIFINSVLLGILELHDDIRDNFVAIHEKSGSSDGFFLKKNKKVKKRGYELEILQFLFLKGHVTPAQLMEN
jgi:hypothetical protein